MSRGPELATRKIRSSLIWEWIHRASTENFRPCAPPIGFSLREMTLTLIGLSQVDGRSTSRTLDWLKERFRRDATKWAYVSIPPDHVSCENGKTFSSEPLVARRDYFRLWLSEMHLQRDRNWFKSWYPVVHTVVHLQFGTQQVEIPYVAGSLNLKDVDDAHLDQSIRINFPITTLVPFGGGVVEIDGGLIAVEGTDDINRLIKAVGNFSALLKPQLSVALGVANTIADSMFELVGATNGQLQLGLHQAFTGTGGMGANQLVGGYFAVVAADQRSINKNSLWVKDNRLYSGSDKDYLTPFIERTHMLFRIEGTSERDDWDGFATIDDPRKRALESIWMGDQKKARNFHSIAMAAVWTLPDLTAADRHVVSAALDKEFKDALTQKAEFKTPLSLPTPAEPRLQPPSTRPAPGVGSTTELNNFLSNKGGLQRVVGSSPVSVSQALGMKDFEFKEIIPSWDVALESLRDIMFEIKPENLMVKIEPGRLKGVESELLSLKKTYPTLKLLKEYTDLTPDKTIRLVLKPSDLRVESNLMKNSKVKDALRSTELKEMG